jgi:hypothetical protein
MAPLVWFTVGLAIWHLAVFVPDRFWGGIVGAFVGAAVGGMITGAIAQLATGATLGETSFATVLYPIPGTIAGFALVYVVGARREQAAAASG